MRDDEKHNPRMLPEYTPWWAPGSLSAEADDSSITSLASNQQANLAASDKLKVTELRALAEQRGLSTEGKKADILEQINADVRLFSLSDDNFRTPQFRTPDAKALPKCYPDMYERVQ